MIRKLKLARRLVAAGLLSLIGIVGITNVSAQQPIAHFPLDADGNSANGEFTASTVTDVEFGSEGAPGLTGTSATFNGSSSLIQHDWSADLNPAESFTLTVWAKSNGGAGAWNSPVTSRHDLNPDSQGYLIYDNEPAGKWTFWSGNGTEDGNWQTLDGPEVNLEEWDHVAIVYDDDAKTKKLYVNGELAVESDDSVAENDTTPFNIGAGEDTGTGFHFKGDIDDIGLWDIALTEAEIVQAMEQGVASFNGGGAGSTLTNGLTGYWPLDDGSGTTAANSAEGEDAQLHNGVEWVDDPDRGSVLSFDGVDGYADAGAETIPQMTQDNDFTWSVWINQAGGNGPNNVVLGNRYSPEGGDFAPREFIKFTPTKFEFHLDGGGQNCEFDDLANSEGVWVHHVVVKTGDTFTHYTDGNEDESSTFTGELQNPQPFYFGGDQTNENWNGMLDDIAIWDRALSAAEVAELNTSGIIFGAVERSFTWDFDGGLPDGSDVAGSAEHSADEGVDGSGALVLTRNVGSQRGGWLSEDIGTVDKFKITFDIYIADGTDTQADGMSMAISDDLETVTDFGEEGPEVGGSKLIVCFDNWDNGGAEGPAIDIKWGKEIVATVPMGTQAESTLDTEGWWPVEMELTPDGDLTISYNDELIHDAVNIPDFESIENARIAFGGRTGGANANQFIDNFKIVLEEGAGGSFVETVPGLIAYWPFDGDLEDAVGNSHGTGQGSEAISFGDGRFGEGISLDGVDQFVETPVENEEMFDFQDGTGFSISAWFTVDSFSKSWQALIAKGEGNRWRVHRRDAESVFTANGGSGDVSQGTTDVSDGAIHHIAVVSDPDGGEVRFYVDGEIEGTAGAPNIESNDFPMMIGENPDARNRTWHGMIDDVGFWARPITEDEIATIYNNGAGNPLMMFVGGGAPPALAKFIPNAAGFVMNVKDGSTTFTDKDLSVSIDGVAVENVTISTAGGVTSIRAALPSPLVAGSVHMAKATFSDSGGSTVRLKKEYEVPAYSVIIPG